MTMRSSTPFDSDGLTPRGLLAGAAGASLARVIAAALALLPVACVLTPDSEASALSVQDLRGILTYDEMMRHLSRVASQRPDDVSLRVAPYTAKTTGRAIPVITVGHGPRTVFITAMQHGNEYRVSNAAVDIVEKLSKRRNAWMRDALTVVVMPRVNVDGFDHTLPGEPWRGLPWRYNVDSTAVGTDNPLLADLVHPFALNGVGYNINRYHPAGLTEDPGAPTQPNPVPESLAIRHVFEQVQPSIMLDMHEQPSDAGNVEGRPVDVAVHWTTPSLGVAPAVLAQEKRIAYAALLANPNKRTALYSFPSDLPGQAHNRYGLLGVPSLLLEFRGLDCWTEDGVFPTCQGGGDPNNRSAVRLATKTVFCILKSIADGSLDLINPALADQDILPYHTTFPTGT